MRGSRKALRIPILMYHSISDDPEPGVHPYYRICTPLALFRQHMQFLYENGYEVIPLKGALELLAGTGTGERSFASPRGSTSLSRSPALPPYALTGCAPSRSHGKYVVLTFDDGYQDFYAHAWPILSDFGFTATVFLPTGLINSAKSGDKASSHIQTKKPLVSADSTPPRAWRFQPSASRPFLTWSQIQELHAQGVSFGSHTVNHVQLQGLDQQEIRGELQDSKGELEDHLGLPVAEFAYPYAYPEADRDFRNLLTSYLKEAGYSCCVTTRIGLASQGDDPFSLRRLPVNGGDDLVLLRAKLEGSYNWLAFVQRLFKSLKRLQRHGVSHGLSFTPSAPLR